MVEFEILAARVSLFPHALVHIDRFVLVRLEHRHSLLRLAVLTFHDTLEEVLLVEIVSLVHCSFIQTSVEVRLVEINIHVSGGATSGLRRPDDRAIHGLRFNDILVVRSADLERLQRVEIDSILPSGRHFAGFNRGAFLDLIERPLLLLRRALVLCLALGQSSLLGLLLDLLFVPVQGNLQFIQVFLLFALYLNRLVLEEAADHRAQREIHSLTQLLELFQDRVEAVDDGLLLDHVI